MSKNNENLTHVLASAIYAATEHGERSSELLAARLLQAIERAGYRIVPAEPTDQMIRKGYLIAEIAGLDDVYRAMIRTANQPIETTDPIGETYRSYGVPTATKDDAS